MHQNAQVMLCSGSNPRRQTCSTITLPFELYPQPLLFVFQAKVLLCIPGWPDTSDPLATVS